MHLGNTLMTPAVTQGPIQFGADVGGTFTDVIAVDAHGGMWTHKVPSTPPHFEQAVLGAIEFLLRQIGVTGEAVVQSMLEHIAVPVGPDERV